MDHYQGRHFNFFQGGGKRKIFCRISAKRVKCAKHKNRVKRVKVRMPSRMQLARLIQCQGPFTPISGPTYYVGPLMGVTWALALYD